MRSPSWQRDQQCGAHDEETASGEEPRTRAKREKIRCGCLKGASCLRQPRIWCVHESYREARGGEAHDSEHESWPRASRPEIPQGSSNAHRPFLLTCMLSMYSLPLGIM